jgi:signal transduction histidine kinase
LCVTSLNFAQWFRNTASARIALARQALEINEANRNLQAEIVSHRSTAERLLQAQKMEALGRLTAGIAHDFNHVLGVIGFAIGLIERDLPSTSAHGRHVATIVHSVDQGSAMTQQLLAFGRKQTLEPQSTDLNELVSGIEQLLATALKGSGKLELQLASEPTPAFVDKNQLEQVILNLVINARDALSSGGVVTIKTANLDLHGEEGLSGSFALISVADTGAGMSEGVRLQAFEPFFTTKTDGTGSGLGLSQVYGFVQQSGGATHIDSHLGTGTTVSIYLPKAAENAV